MGFGLSKPISSGWIPLRLINWLDMWFSRSGLPDPAAWSKYLDIGQELRCRGRHLHSKVDNGWLHLIQRHGRDITTEGGEVNARSGASTKNSLCIRPNDTGVDASSMKKSVATATNNVHLASARRRSPGQGTGTWISEELQMTLTYRGQKSNQ